MPLFVITGNATEDGRPVYRDPRGSWTHQIVDAAAYERDDERDEQLEHARREERVVCDPYPIEVAREGGRLVPTRLKERIRADGPTVV